jgi:probable rRNA maturation factor
MFVTVKNKAALKEMIVAIFKKEKVLLKRLDYVFCSDELLLNINQEFLKHDYYTDIITFNLSETKDVQGEIYVSIDRVKENAASNNIFFKEELARVLFHGALHLCGYKDKKKEETSLMRKKENYYLGCFHVKQF